MSPFGDHVPGVPGQHLDAWSEIVVLGVEVVEEPSDRGGVIGSGAPDRHLSHGSAASEVVLCMEST